MSDNLSENGLVSQWIPAWEFLDDDMMIMYNTFHSVFPYVYVYKLENDDAAQLIFIGSNKEVEIPQHNLYLFNQDDVKYTNTILNTDDKPYLEFSTAYNLYNPLGDEIIYFEFKDPLILERLND